MCSERSLGGALRACSAAGQRQAQPDDDRGLRKGAPIDGKVATISGNKRQAEWTRGKRIISFPPGDL